MDWVVLGFFPVIKTHFFMLMICSKSVEQSRSMGVESQRHNTQHLISSKIRVPYHDSQGTLKMKRSSSRSKLHQWTSFLFFSTDLSESKIKSMRDFLLLSEFLRCLRICLQILLMTQMSLISLPHISH